MAPAPPVADAVDQGRAMAVTAAGVTLQGMKRHALALASGIVTALWVGGCRPADTAGPGRGGGGGAGGAGGSAGGGGVNTSSVSSAGGGPEGKVCGGRLGQICWDGEYCRFPPSGACGEGGATGRCESRPELCAEDCPGACACDEQVYCNACMANAAGVDVAPEAGVCAQAVTCDGATHRIANDAARGGMCTSVVRLDYQTREIKSAFMACAPAVAVTPVRARERAEKDTGFGAEAQMISGLAPADEYVFWEPPTDRGGVSAVSARSGLTVFGGSIVMNEKGGVVYPASFVHPATLGLGCGSSAPLPPARGLDVGTIEDLSQADVEAALGAVWSTALPDALAIGSTLLDAMVLLYPPQVGLADPSAMEWVVLLNSSAIE